jgi:hypothetical protein
VALAAIPSLVCGLSLLWTSRAVQRWVEGWEVLPVSILGQDVARIDLVRALGLERLVGALQSISATPALVFLVSVACMAIVAGLVLAVTGLMLGLVYNGLASLTGGIVVEASARPARSRRADPE